MVNNDLTESSAHFEQHALEFSQKFFIHVSKQVK